MGTVFAADAFEFDHRGHVFQRAVTIFVRQPIQRIALRTAGRDVYITVQSQNALAILDFVAVRFDRIRNVVFVAVIDQQQRTVCSARQQVAKLVERDRNQ